ncbi:MAG: prolyl oligopeptidase family serine peptidase, partial [Bacteroidota bacterium]|nr:prolyl oligopeptidase family serine peptidase [Bacteroidota bacterium]
MGGEAPVYYPGFRTYRYASAGDTISTVTVHVYQLKIRSSRKLSVPVDADGYIPRIRFTRRNNQLAVMTLNRNQNEFKLFFVNPKSGVAKLILTDQSDTYVCPDFDEIQFSTNYFTYLSEKDGYRHLYLYNANGGLRKKLTAGKWDVTKFLGCDTIKGLFYYQAAVESPMKRSVWQVDLNGKTRRISTVDGVCDGVFNRNYTLFVQTASTIKTPKITTLCNVSGQALRTISDNKALKTRLSEISYADKTFFTVPATDGQILNGWMLKPANFDASKKYPVIQLQYSGPDAQEVLDRFNFDWEYYLAEKGFVVVSVDGRGTGGRGADFRRLTYGKLGQLESQDQIAVANYLKKQAYIDGSRMGIWGWSFGGFITLMSMTNPDSPFKAGVAVAPVTDYRYYDAMYTERYMKTPAENKEGYDAGSPLLRASQLKGRLLLVHGLADDNVRANQSLDFDEALIRAGIRFDSQFYPISNHSILGETYRRHLYNTKVEFFLKNL